MLLKKFTTPLKSFQFFYSDDRGILNTFKKLNKDGTMKAMIIVQENQFSIDTLYELQACIQNTYAKHFRSDKLTVIWNLMPTGCAITDRQPSQSSLVSVQVPNNTHRQVREAFLNDCFKSWRDITKQDADHIMVSALDSDVFTELLKSNLGRLSLMGKLSFISNMVCKFIQSKLRHNLLISSFTQI